MNVYSLEVEMMQYAFCATATRLRRYSAWLSCSCCRRRASA